MYPRTFYLRCIICGTLLFGAWELAFAVFAFEHLGLFGTSTAFAPRQTAVMLAFLAAFVILLMFAWIYGKKHLPEWGAKQRLILTGLTLVSPVTGFGLFCITLWIWETVN